MNRPYHVGTGKVVSRHPLHPGMEGIHLLPLTQQNSLIHISHQMAVMSQAGRCLDAEEAVEFEKQQAFETAIILPITSLAPGSGTGRSICFS